MRTSPTVINDFATVFVWIFLYMRKINFYFFISVDRQHWMAIRIRIRFYILMPNPDPEPTSSKKMKKFYYFCSRQCQLTLFYLSHQCHRCHNFQFFGPAYWIFWKKYSFSLQLLKSFRSGSGFYQAGSGCRSWSGSGKMMPILPDSQHCHEAFSWERAWAYNAGVTPSFSPFPP